MSNILVEVGWLLYCLVNRFARPDDRISILFKRRLVAFKGDFVGMSVGPSVGRLVRRSVLKKFFKIF